MGLRRSWPRDARTSDAGALAHSLDSHDHSPERTETNVTDGPFHDGGAVMKTVLWAGNDDSIEKVLEPVYRRRGIRLVQARNGMEALELIRIEHPAVAVVEERFSHREWLLGILREDPADNPPALIFPERARYQPGFSDLPQPPLPLMPALVDAPPGSLPPPEITPWRSVNLPEPGGNPSMGDAMKQLDEFYVQLVLLLKQAEESQPITVEPAGPSDAR